MSYSEAEINEKIENLRKKVDELDEKASSPLLTKRDAKIIIWSILSIFAILLVAVIAEVYIAYETRNIYSLLAEPYDEGTEVDTNAP